MTATSAKPRITVDAGVCNGKPVIRGTRVTVETVLGYLGAGDSAEDILAQYPQLEAADISACLEFASRLMGHGFNIKETVMWDKNEGDMRNTS